MLVRISQISLVFISIFHWVQLAACLTIGSLDEARVFRIVEACEWLEGVMPTLEVPNIDPAFVNMRAVCSLLCLFDFQESYSNLFMTHGSFVFAI